MNIIGKPRRRVDARAKVTGQTRFADQVELLVRLLAHRPFSGAAIFAAADSTASKICR